ncbi:MAG TPA: lysoplasmalogenase family protein, partial [Flavobacteriales bacterium]|nr:lysoplasmalogenase family protein [Flavobacteriales bacterium]
HVCYTLAFALNVADSPGGQGLLVSASIGLVVIGYVGAFGSMLLEHLEEGFAVPVGFYALGSVALCVAAALRFGRTYMPSFIMVMGGVLLLLASDSVLASARFVHPVEHAWWSVPILYAAAQYLIARGCLRHVLDPEEIRRRASLDT